MRTFKIPYDIAHEEKLFGGVFSVRQFLYILIDICAIALLFIPLPLFLRILLFLFTFPVPLIFAFVNVGGMYADRYTLIILKYLLRNKKMYWQRG